MLTVTNPGAGGYSVLFPPLPPSLGPINPKVIYQQVKANRKRKAKRAKKVDQTEVAYHFALLYGLQCLTNLTPDPARLCVSYVMRKPWVLCQIFLNSADFDAFDHGPHCTDCNKRLGRSPKDEIERT